MKKYNIPKEKYTEVMGQYTRLEALSKEESKLERQLDTKRKIRHAEKAVFWDTISEAVGLDLDNSACMLFNEKDMTVEVAEDCDDEGHEHRGSGIMELIADAIKRKRDNDQ